MKQTPMNFDEVFRVWQDNPESNQLGYSRHRLEGENGVRILRELVETIDPNYTDIEEFLSDNPGCIEAIVNWIEEQSVESWTQNLFDSLPEEAQTEVTAEDQD